MKGLKNNPSKSDKKSVFEKDMGSFWVKIDSKGKSGRERGCQEIKKNYRSNLRQNTSRLPHKVQREILLCICLMAILVQKALLYRQI